MAKNKPVVKEKATLKDLLSAYDNRHHDANSFKKKFVKWLIELNSQLSMHELLLIEKGAQKILCPSDLNMISMIIERRINNFNELVECSLPGIELLTKSRFKEWFENLDHVSFITKANIELFANLAKEVNTTNYNFSEKIKLCLLAKIDDQVESWLTDKEAQYNLDYVMVTSLVHTNCDLILTNYDVNKNFISYYKTCVKNKFHDILKIESKIKSTDDNILPHAQMQDNDNMHKEYRTDIFPKAAENDYSAKHNEEQHLIQAFITCTLAIFTRSKQKPHKRLIFWNEYMYYTTNKNTMAIDHETFIKDYSDDILKALWSNVQTRTALKGKEYVEYIKYGIDNLNHNYCENIKQKLNTFNDILKKLFKSVYIETEYRYMVKKYKLSCIEDVVTNDFFKDQNGENLDFENTKKRISNWNSSLKKELRVIFAIQSMSSVKKDFIRKFSP